MKWRTAVTLAMLLTAVAVDVRSEGSAAIAVTVDGFRTDAGQAVVLLYRDEGGFCRDASKAVRRETAAIRDLAVHIRFGDLAPGSYAVWVFHDANRNGQLDKSFIGIPKEGTGVSNNVRGSFGPPKFKDARFEVGPGVRDISIRVVYL